MHYTVDPGLYALGSPDRTSPVLVTASYKMSFDYLRSALPGRDAWILVLDTKGINVWCSAGKGTFGTTELVDRIAASALEMVVDHRSVILPQLAGPGVAAHMVKKLSGFHVTYGPIRAEDLPTFLDNGLKAAPEMRIKTFHLQERAVLVPVELVGALKSALIILPVLLILSGILGKGGFLENISRHGLFAVPALLTAIIAGAILAPLLLPYLPGRAFSIKGLPLGLLGGAVLICFRWDDLSALPGQLEIVAWLLLVLAATTYLSMNFTGCSTYTSLSGVKKEMRWAMPLELGAGAAGLILWVSSILVT